LAFIELKYGSLYWDVAPDEPRLLRLTASAAVKEKRLAALLEGRQAEMPRLLVAVRRAQAAGSLELSGIEATVDALDRMMRAQAAVDPQSPLTVGAVLAWHRAATGTDAGFRARERTRNGGGPPPAPAEFAAVRLRNLEEWLGAATGTELKPAQQAALALARIVEISPFDDGNGRVARLAASHLMVRAGSRPPVLTGEDRGRLLQALRSAFQLQTEPLASLLDEAAERALDVMARGLSG
jgi:Fic family protein